MTAIIRPCPIEGAGRTVLSVKVRQIIGLIEGDGWYQVAQKGSHRQFKHPSKPGRVTVPGKPSMDLTPKLEKSILSQAGLKKLRRVK